MDEPACPPRVNRTRQLCDLYDACRRAEQQSRQSAERYRVAAIIVMLWITIAGSVIVPSALTEFRGSKYVLAGLGLSIALLKTLSSAMRIEARGKTLKQLSIRLRSLLRRIQQMAANPAVTTSYAELSATLQQLYREFDELDLSLFDAESSVTHEQLREAQARPRPAPADTTGSDDAPAEALLSLRDSLERRDTIIHV